MVQRHTINDRSNAAIELPYADGFRGIWYSNQATGNEFVYKYSGGLATYPQQHAPIAIYAPDVNQTFFVFGGTLPDNSTLLHMIACYDHSAKKVSRPRVLVNKQTTDAHDNPVLSLDKDGYVWVFSNTHGNAPRASYIFRSAKPYDITSFSRIDLPHDVFPEQRFNYGQPWYLPGHGFVFLHTRYGGNNHFRQLYTTTSSDGYSWTSPRALSAMPNGQYQISYVCKNRIVTALNYHPPEGEFNARTRLYYLESTDAAHSWQNAEGKTLALPLNNKNNEALVYDYEREGKLVYLKNITMTPDGEPVILYLLSTHYNPGPLSPARQLWTARWDGHHWIRKPVVTTDHNYDFAPLVIDACGQWRMMGPFLPGPQAYGTGGEIGLWTSDDQGANWTMVRQVTRNSLRNHTYMRHPVHAQDDFYMFWADGNAFAPSVSHLYFTDRNGDVVYRLPEEVDRDWVEPEPVRMDARGPMF